VNGSVNVKQPSSVALGAMTALVAFASGASAYSTFLRSGYCPRGNGRALPASGRSHQQPKSQREETEIESRDRPADDPASHRELSKGKQRAGDGRSRRNKARFQQRRYQAC
jgi:hypothetical protein